MSNPHTMAIPMVDVQSQYAQLRTEIEPLVCEVLASGRYILGPHMHAFEREFAEYLHVKEAISCASGTDALHLALLAAGVGPGDEVVTSPFTFAATAEAICYVGAQPVFADIESDSWNLDPDAVRATISVRTKALLPVHIFGQAANMDALSEIAREHDLVVLEDCAQSVGARWKGRVTGGLGTVAAFSFFPSKNLGAAGDAGMITTNSVTLAERLRMLRNHGSRERYYHEILGFNSRLDEIQAAVLRIKLRHLDRFTDGRRRVADCYRRHLDDIPDLTLPSEVEGASHVYHQFTVLVPRREQVMQRLAAADIAHAIYYPAPLHQQAPFRDPKRLSDCPVSDHVARHCLSLPMYPELSAAQVQRVAEVLRQAVTLESRG